jgi:hypothetical protein
LANGADWKLDTQREDQEQPTNSGTSLQGPVKFWEGWDHSRSGSETQDIREIIGLPQAGEVVAASG